MNDNIKALDDAHRKEWEEQFLKAGSLNDTKMLMGEFENSFDSNEWTENLDIQEVEEILKFKTTMNTFTFIVGPVAAGKTIFMENKLYNIRKNDCNFFDHDQEKLMIQLYGVDKNKVNDLNLAIALNNAIADSLENYKDFMMQIYFTNEQLEQINTYLNEYQHKFVFNAHFIAVSEAKILKERANKRELLGGHSSEEKSIEKSFNQSFKNFITHLPKFNNVSIWDNSKDFGFNSMEPQLMFENGVLTSQNPNITNYSKELLKEISANNI